MTEPVKKAQFTGYVGLQGGMVQSTKLNYSDIGAVFGAEAKYNGAFIRGQVGVGTALSGDLQLGTEVDLGRNFGLELSAKGKAGFSFKPAEIDVQMHDQITHDCVINNPDGTNNLINNVMDSNSDYKFSVMNGEQRIGGRVKLTYSTPKSKFGIGVDVGIHKGMFPDLTLNMKNVAETTINTSDGPSYDITSVNDNIVTLRNDAAGYVTPVASYERTLNNSGSVSLRLDADIYEGKATLIYSPKPKEAKLPPEEPETRPNESELWLEDDNIPTREGGFDP